MENEKKKLDGGKIITTVIITVSTAIVFLALGYWAGTLQSEEAETATDTTALSSATTTASSVASTSASATASTTSTADWKTYTNSEYGFSFKYPKDWTMTEKGGSNSDASVVSITSPETLELIERNKIDGKNYGPYSDDMSVYYYNSVADETENKNNNLGATTLDQLVEKNTMISKIGVTKLGDSQAIDATLAGEGTYYTVLATPNQHLYKVMFMNISNKDKLSSEENQILSTFQFTSK